MVAGEDTGRNCPRSGTHSLYSPRSPGGFDFERQDRWIYRASFRQKKQHSSSKH